MSGLRDRPQSMSTRPGRPPEAKPSAPASRVRVVFLVGFMGAGKSSVGLALSRRLGWSFEDLDEQIQSREQRTIAQIFQQSGEATFRRVEHEVLRSLVRELGAARAKKVVALGGGAFVQASNAALLEQDGFSIIFLDAPAEELFRRCQQDELERPLRRELQEFRALYHARRDGYMKASLRIETSGKDVVAVVEEVIRSLGLRSESAPL
jgi:shikimate kinase